MSLKKINKVSKKKSKIKQKGGLCLDVEDINKETYFNILLHYFVNNQILEYLKKQFGFPVGYSDHMSGFTGTYETKNETNV